MAPSRTGSFGAAWIRDHSRQDDADIAFAPVTALSRWIQSKKLTSERLTGIYLARIEKFDPKLRAIITLNKEGALAAARQADKEIAAGKYRGPLHGIPYGVKDLLGYRRHCDDVGCGAVQESGSQPRTLRSWRGSTRPAGC